MGAPTTHSARSQEEPDAVHPHVGRPRDPSRDEAIRRAVLDILIEHGYERVTIEAVAARAEAGKATVYRRWASKEELVLDAVADLHGTFVVPDTGSLVGDVAQLCIGLSEKTEGRAWAVMQGLASAIRHDAALAAAFDRHFVAPRRAALADVFERAVARGEMPPGKDLDLLTSLVPAVMAFQLSRDAEPPGPDFVRRVVTELLLPAATAPAVSLDRPPRHRRDSA